MINEILKDNWNAQVHIGGSMWWYDNKKYPHTDPSTYDPYLFLKREIGVTATEWKDAKKNGIIRHCKVIRGGKFYDYIVRKEFASIQDWLQDAGAKLEDILYGTNRIHKTFAAWNEQTGRTEWQVGKPYYMTLMEALTPLGYKEPPMVEIPEYTGTKNLTDLIDLEMRMHGLTINNVFVAKDGNITAWNQFMQRN